MANETPTIPLTPSELPSIRDQTKPTTPGESYSIQAIESENYDQEPASEQKALQPKQASLPKVDANEGFSPSRKPTLFTLPQEIRDLIYDFAYAGKNGHYNRHFLVQPLTTPRTTENGHEVDVWKSEEVQNDLANSTELFLEFVLPKLSRQLKPLTDHTWLLPRQRETRVYGGLAYPQKNDLSRVCRQMRLETSNYRSPPDIFSFYKGGPWHAFESVAGFDSDSAVPCPLHQIIGRIFTNVLTIGEAPIKPRSSSSASLSQTTYAF